MEPRSYLQSGTVLDGSYSIVRAVGAGGFGVTYEADDIHLGTKVAIKEYFPEEFSVRTRELQVRPSSERVNTTFEWGRAGFLQEAKTLAKFRHASIVRVLRIFEANSTAYMVMEFESGPSFERWLRELKRPPSQDELDHIVAPLLDALEMMHAEDFLHRDIAPDNIIIRSDTTPVLLDFGASRKTVAAKTHAMTGMFKAGYSPQEQYSTEGKHQGPWTDFYALGATLYRAVTGVVPDQAPDRGLHDVMQPAAQSAKGQYRTAFLEAIGTCMQVKPTDRPKAVFQVREMLLTPDGVVGHARPDVETPPTTIIPQRQRDIHPVLWVVLVVLAILAVGGGATYYVTQKRAEDARGLAEIRAEIAVATTIPALDQLERREPRLHSEIDARRQKLSAIVRSQRLSSLKEFIGTETDVATLDRIATEEPTLRQEVEARKLALQAGRSELLRARRARIPLTTDLAELDRIAKELPELAIEVATRKLEIRTSAGILRAR